MSDNTKTKEKNQIRKQRVSQPEPQADEPIMVKLPDNPAKKEFHAAVAANPWPTSLREKEMDHVTDTE